MSSRWTLILQCLMRQILRLASAIDGIGSYTVTRAPRLASNTRIGASSVSARIMIATCVILIPRPMHWLKPPLPSGV